MLRAMVDEVDSSPGPLMTAFSPLPLDPSTRRVLFHDLHDAVKVRPASPSAPASHIHPCLQRGCLPL